MLTLNSRQFREKLVAWLRAKMHLLVLGPPGTGKTYTSRMVAIQAFGKDIVEVVDGGNESDWKQLFPYKTPAGTLELGKALRASGYKLDQGKLIKAQPGGVLIIDEFNRVPPEMKSAFQLLASEKIVPWPEGGQVELDSAIVSTGNQSDLGVEEASGAELDRYDLTIRLAPTPEEQAQIVMGETGVTKEAAEVIYSAVAELASRLDPKKVHLPEGLRLAISVAKVLLTGTLGPADVFRGAAERCWPLGRRGAEKYRAEFDNIVMDAAGKLASKLGNIGDLTPRQAQQPTAQTAPAGGTGAIVSFSDLLTSLANSTLSQISTPGAIALPKPFSAMLYLFISSFGMGCAKYLTENRLAGKDIAERAGVKLHFGKNGSPDAVEFRNADRHRVEKFCNACEKV